MPTHSSEIFAHAHCETSRTTFTTAREPVGDAKYGRLSTLHSFERISARTARSRSVGGGKYRGKEGEEPESHGRLHNAPRGARFSAVCGRIPRPYRLPDQDTAGGSQHWHLQNQAAGCEYCPPLFFPLSKHLSRVSCPGFLVSLGYHLTISPTLCLCVQSERKTMFFTLLHMEACTKEVT